MSISSGIIIIVLIFIGVQLERLSKTLGGIHETLTDQHKALVKLAGDERMERSIEFTNNVGATLTDEMLEYKHGVLVRANYQLERIAAAVESLVPEAPAPEET